MQTYATLNRLAKQFVATFEPSQSVESYLLKTNERRNLVKTINRFNPERKLIFYTKALYELQLLQIRLAVQREENETALEAISTELEVINGEILSLNALSTNESARAQTLPNN